MICTFFGHSDAPDSIKEDLRKKILHIVENVGVKTFYVGNNGNFDFLVQSILAEMSIEKSFEFSIVLSYVNEKALSGNQEATIFPEGLEKALPKFAISKRNEWLIKKSNYAIVYLEHRFSNSCKWVEKSKKSGLKIINVAKV